MRKSRLMELSTRGRLGIVGSRWEKGTFIQGLKKMGLMKRELRHDTITAGSTKGNAGVYREYRDPEGGTTYEGNLPANRIIHISREWSRE